MLEATARFHTYSPNNVLLLMLQGAEGRVAGYRTWQRIPARDGGMCQVAKGARALRILAPMVGRTPAADDGDKREPGATPERGPGPKRLYGFRVVSVFDESQLVGPPAIEEVAPTLLEGHGPAGVYDALAAQVVAAGFEVAHDAAIAPANGTTNYLTRIVTLREGMSPAQRCKTMAHELAHVRLHDPSGPGAPLPRSQKEVEAESVAWLVTRHAGLAADGYSFPYVAHWSGGQVERVRAVIDRAVPTARSITASLDQILARPQALTPANVVAATAEPGQRGGIAAPGRELAGQAAGRPGLADPPGLDPKGQTTEEPPDVVFARSVTRRCQKPPRVELPGLGLS